MWWNSSQFAMPVTLASGMPVMESGITFQLGTVTLDPVCASATATITNIQGSMDGLDLTCYSEIPMQDFSSTVMFGVIGKWKFSACTLNLFLACFWLTYASNCVPCMYTCM